MNTARPQSFRRTALFALTLLVLGLYGGPSPALDSALALVPYPTLQVSLDAATTITGPDQLTDNPYHTLGTDPTAIAYLANADTHAFRVNASGGLSPLPGLALSRGMAGAFDSCGSWLNSTFQDGAVVRGWYHAETNCNYQGTGHPTQKSVAYAESSDGGQTFTKVAYPNNQVITAPTIYLPPIDTKPNDGSEGDQHVIRVGAYFYMYFIAARDYQVRVARSLVTDGGKPGTWYKYNNGTWTEPGLGGQSSPIAQDVLTRSWVSYSPSLGLFVGVSYFANGFGLAVSADGVTNWRKATGVVLSFTGAYWDRTASSGELLDYPSFINIDGSSQTIGTTFWWYYMQLKPGQDFPQGRYLVRRSVRIVPTSSTNLFDTAPRIALTRYQSATAPDTWVTTTNPDPQFHAVKMLGSLFTIQPEPNALPIYDCYLTQENDHMLDIRQDCGAPGNANVHDLRQMGWISTIPFTNALRIYRCFDSAALNHFVSSDPGCEGKQTEWAIGYLDATPYSLPDPKTNGAAVGQASVQAATHPAGMGSGMPRPQPRPH